ncbi:hypothetical protein Y032_0789g2362 [Ancylostoma ceylanicum]|uniref:Uncharacterized protein n=1 Tax=Ancylostoma ceylanicum TaxID=53326 RepID=A0A016WDU2_9BILA|nr:hypothetical protein Y032_0789g2362 [Ancylostoma ceylanicum]
MVAAAQLRLLLWKNWLQKIRTPWHTLSEFIIPLLLTGISLGAMIAVKDKYEQDHDASNYRAWPVMGSAYDFITPTNELMPESAILDLTSILSNTTTDCVFLNVSQVGDGGIHLDVKLIYTPITESTRKIMEHVQKRYSITIPNPLGTFYEQRNDFIQDNIPNFFQSSMSIQGFNTEEDMVAYAKKSFSNKCGNPLLAPPYELSPDLLAFEYFIITVVGKLGYY